MTSRIFLWALLLLLGVASTVTAIVVRPAANVAWVGSDGKLRGFSAFKGQPIVLVIAPSPRSWKFRSQLGQFHKMYQRMAAQRVIFMAAFTQEPGLVKSNIPFVLAADGPRVGYDYDIADGFAIAVIGRDGNLDYITGKVLPAQRVYDLIGASFVSQESQRR